jgi:hypothetical protein
MRLVTRAVALAVAIGLGGGQEKAFSTTDFGHGRPVTTQDLSGKHFCWSNGVRTFYGADGMVSTISGVHNRPWFIPEPGALKVGRKHVSVEVLSDGRLHAYIYCLICNEHDSDGWATRCD